MSVKILFRLTDGPGGRKKGDIVEVLDDPKSDGHCGMVGKTNRYGVVMIKEGSIKDYAFLGNRHYAEFDSEAAKESATPTFKCRSEYRIDVDAFLKSEVEDFAKVDPVALTESGFITKAIDQVKILQKENSLTERADKTEELAVSIENK